MKLEAPQLIYLSLTLIGIGLVGAKHGQPKDNYNFWTETFASAIIWGLLYWGGFFG